MAKRSNIKSRCADKSDRSHYVSTHYAVQEREMCVAEVLSFVLRNTEATSVYDAKSAAFAQTFEYISELRVLEHTRI
jgi:hypothetical protein